MRKLRLLFLFVIVLLASCSSQTLQEAISSSPYGNYDSPEILYNNDETGVVIFLTKNSNGDFIICRSSYEKDKFDRYALHTGDDYSMTVDIAKKSEFIRMDQIGADSETPINIVWGGVFNYPGAKHVKYKVQNDQQVMYQNEVDINKKHVFVDVLSEEFSESYSISYDITDKEGNTMFSFH